jgi:hypothetical protein
MELDLQKMAQQFMMYVIMGGAGWLFTTVLKLKKDLNAAFHKIRRLEEKIDGQG